MEDVRFISVEINVDGHVDMSDYDFGAVTLICEGRSYIVDVVRSFWTQDNGCTTIRCEVEKDEDTFDETYTKYDLKTEDLINPELRGYIFVGDEYAEQPIEYMTLFVKIGGMTKAIDLINENEMK